MPQKKRAAAEVAEKRAAEAIRSDDEPEDIDPESQEKDELVESVTAGKRPPMAGAAAKAKLAGILLFGISSKILLQLNFPFY